MVKLIGVVKVGLYVLLLNKRLFIIRVIGCYFVRIYYIK